jgi:hypothetical protein
MRNAFVVVAPGCIPFGRRVFDGRKFRPTDLFNFHEVYATNNNGLKPGSPFVTGLKSRLITMLF